MLNKKLVYFLTITALFFNSAIITFPINNTDDGFLKAEDFEKNIGDFGEGVKIIKSSKVTNDYGEGIKIVYEFKDINKFLVNQNPAKNLGEESSEMVKSKDELIQFKYNKDNSGQLTILLPKEKETNKKESVDNNKDNKDSQKMLNDILSYFKGMKLVLKIEVIGKIQKTNAAFVNGNTITIMDINFDKILENPDALKKLGAADVESVNSLKVLNDQFNIKFEPKEVVTVDFK